MKTVDERLAQGAGSIAWMLTSRYSRGISLAPENEGGAEGSEGAGDDSEAENKGAAGEQNVEGGEKKSGVSDEAAKLLKEVMKHKAQAKELQSKVGELEPLKTAIDELGGIDALKALAQAQKSKEQEELERKGEFDRVKAMIVEENQKKVKAAEDARVAAETKIAEQQRVIDDLTVGAAFAASKVMDDLVLPPSKARDLFGPYFEREDGELVAYDRPRGKANRVKLVGADGEPMLFDAALRKLVESDPDKDRLLKSKIISGANSKTIDAKGAAKTGELFGKDRIAAALAKSFGKK